MTNKNLIIYWSLRKIKQWKQMANDSITNTMCGQGCGSSSRSAGITLKKSGRRKMLAICAKHFLTGELLCLSHAAFLLMQNSYKHEKLNHCSCSVYCSMLLDCPLKVCSYDKQVCWVSLWCVVLYGFSKAEILGGKTP